MWQGEPVTQDGILETWIRDGLDGSAEVTQRLRSPDTLESWELRFLSPPPERIEAGDRLTVNGVRLEHTIIVDTYAIHRVPKIQRKSLPAKTSPSSVPTAVPLKTAVILVETQDHPSRPYTPAQIQRLMFDPANSVSSFFMENSYERVWLEGPVTEWYTVPLSVGKTCPDAQIFDEALRAARPALGDYGQYDHGIVLLSGLTTCPFGGEAGVGGKTS